MTAPGTSGRPVLFDPGLQPERTRLAWRRTLLALVVAVVAGERVLAVVIGRTALAGAGAALVVVLALAVLVARRARAADASLRDRGDLSAGHGATVLAATALLCAAGGALALVLLVGRALAGG